ncbi:MAG TPA: SDR family NAD(P)-dependent oxidoreductase, partial [Candidatus Acidoferrum sp.]|nr:SDR family NAD(P)-dependent oxidoreductase [Candidatus Acidoferrum sp.]
MTGAGRGLGAETAVALSRAGAEVVLMSRTREELEQIASQIDSGGGQSKLLVCDVTDSVDLRSQIARLDRLDILVNNAGMNIPEPFVEVSEAHLDQQLALNVRSA